MRFQVGNKAAATNGPMIRRLIVTSLASARPAETWECDIGDRIGPLRQLARHHPDDCSYTWLTGRLARATGSPYRNWKLQMAILRALRRLQDEGHVRLTSYACGRIGAVRLLPTSLTNEHSGAVALVTRD